MSRADGKDSSTGFALEVTEEGNLITLHAFDSEDPVSRFEQNKSIRVVKDCTSIWSRVVRQMVTGGVRFGKEFAIIADLLKHFVDEVKAIHFLQAEDVRRIL